MAAVSVIAPRQEEESHMLIVHPQHRHLRTHPTTVVSIPFDVRFFTGIKLSQIITTSGTTNTMSAPTLRMPLGILTALMLTTRGDVDDALSTVVSGLLVEQVCAGVVSGVAGGRSMLRELKKGAFQWVCLSNTRGTTTIVRSIVDMVSAITISSSSKMVDIMAVFRGRGGKGKAAALARLERKGREYRRATQMAAHTARRTGQTMTGAAATATRRSQAASLLTERVGRGDARGGGNRRHTGDHNNIGDGGSGGNERHRDIEADADRNPNHPLAVLRRKQERERLEIERLRGVAKSAVARGMMKFSQLEQASSAPVSAESN